MTPLPRSPHLSAWSSPLPGTYAPSGGSREDRDNSVAMDSERLSWRARMNGRHGRRRASRGDCPTRNIVSQQAAGVRACGAPINGQAPVRAFRRKLDERKMPLGGLYLLRHHRMWWHDRTASAGQSFDSLSPETRKGLSPCSA